VSKKLKLVHFEEGSDALMQFASSDCHNAECLLFTLIGVPVIAATSFIVSGSIVVIGNTLHWIEKQGTCDDSATQSIINNISSIAFINFESDMYHSSTSSGCCALYA
jgi:hypothetical protein